MRGSLVVVTMAFLLAGCESGGMMGSKDHVSPSHLVVTPDHINWQPGPPGLPAGGQFAVLEGDPAKSGFFTIRASLPDGYRVQPHYHPGVERVTVISGTFYLGEGDRFDESAARALPAGSYTSMTPGMHHYAWAKGPTVIQISTLGPWGITYVNPADDPRNMGK
jgi:quercetin dioxygenase-like cupin family protein